jgi:ketosteroid isomerase-like protein
VRAVLEAWNREDRETALAYVDPDVVIDATRRRINPKTYAGTDGLREMLRDLDEVWDEFRVEALEFIDAGDRVVVVGRSVGKGKGSGIEVDQSGAHLFALRDGRIVRWELGYADRDHALEAAGLA